MTCVNGICGQRLCQVDEKVDEVAKVVLEVGDILLLVLAHFGTTIDEILHRVQHYRHAVKSFSKKGHCLHFHQQVGVLGLISQQCQRAENLEKQLFHGLNDAGRAWICSIFVPVLPQNLVHKLADCLEALAPVIEEHGFVWIVAEIRVFTVLQMRGEKFNTLFEFTHFIMER